MTRTLGACSVCLAEHVLLGADGSRPVRHGFAAQNVRHGESGGWHTGPCFGGDWLDLSASCDGTRQAEREATGHLASLRISAERLAARPVLHWSATRGRGANAKTHERSLADGDAADHSIGCPSYDDEHATRTREIARSIGDVERALVQYATVIREWTPGKWPTREDGGPVAAVHLEATWRFSRKGSPIMIGACSRGSQNPAPQRTTRDHAAVTCGRCLREIASGEKEKARRAAVLHYAVTLPDGTVEKTTNEYRGTKRPLVAAVLAMRAASGELPARWFVDAWCVSDATTRKAEKEARTWAAEVRVVALQAVAL